MSQRRIRLEKSRANWGTHVKSAPIAARQGEGVGEVGPSSLGVIENGRGLRPPLLLPQEALPLLSQKPNGPNLRPANDGLRGVSVQVICSNKSPCASGGRCPGQRAACEH